MEVLLKGMEDAGIGAFFGVLRQAEEALGTGGRLWPPGVTHALPGAARRLAVRTQCKTRDRRECHFIKP